MPDAASKLEFPPRRGHARLRLGIRARLITLDGQKTVELLDLSEGGARLLVRGSAEISAGVLRWMTFEAFGFPAWREGQEIGLQFENPISPAAVLETRKLLPAYLDPEDDVRRSAGDWAIGSGSVSASAGMARPRASPLRSRSEQPSASQSPGERRRSAVLGWIRAGAPFMAGGAGLGLLIGYWTSLL